MGWNPTPVSASTNLSIGFIYDIPTIFDYQGDFVEVGASYTSLITGVSGTGFASGRDLTNYIKGNISWNKVVKGWSLSPGTTFGVPGPSVTGMFKWYTLLDWTSAPNRIEKSLKKSDKSDNDKKIRKVVKDKKEQLNMVSIIDNLDQDNIGEAYRIRKVLWKEGKKYIESRGREWLKIKIIDKAPKHLKYFIKKCFTEGEINIEYTIDEQ